MLCTYSYFTLCKNNTESQQNFCADLVCNNVISDFPETKERIINFYGMKAYFMNCGGLCFITHPDITSP